MDVQQEVRCLRLIWKERYLRHRSQESLEGGFGEGLLTRQRPVGDLKATTHLSCAANNSTHIDRQQVFVQRRGSVGSALQQYHQLAAERYRAHLESQIEKQPQVPTIKFTLWRLRPFRNRLELRPNRHSREKLKVTSQKLGIGPGTAHVMAHFQTGEHVLRTAFSSDPFAIRAARYLQEHGKEAFASLKASSLFHEKEGTQRLNLEDVAQVRENHPASLCRQLHEELQHRQQTASNTVSWSHSMTSSEAIPAFREKITPFSVASRGRDLWTPRCRKRRGNAAYDLHAEQSVTMHFYGERPDTSYRKAAAERFVLWKKRMEERRARAEDAMRLEQTCIPAIHTNENLYLWDVQNVLFMHGTRLSRAERHAQIVLDKYTSP